MVLQRCFYEFDECFPSSIDDWFISWLDALWRILGMLQNRDLGQRLCYRVSMTDLIGRRLLANCFSLSLSLLSLFFGHRIFWRKVEFYVKEKVIEMIIEMMTSVLVVLCRTSPSRDEPGRRWLADSSQILRIRRLVAQVIFIGGGSVRPVLDLLSFSIRGFLLDLIAFFSSRVVFTGFLTSLTGFYCVLPSFT